MCVFISAVPITKLFVWGEGDSGGHVLRVDLALCRELIVRDIEEILKLLDATCPGVREVGITGCSDEVMRVHSPCGR